MLPFKSYYKILCESPDKVNNIPWTLNTVAFGMIKSGTFGIPRRTHTDIYNIMYMYLHNCRLPTKTILNDFAKFGLTYIGNLQETKSVIQERFKRLPWSYVNRDKDPGSTSTEILRNTFFDVCGRFWMTEKMCSFWNTFNVVERYIPQLKDILNAYKQNIEEYKFEFIDEQGKFYTYEEITSGKISSTQTSNTTKKLMRIQHTSPEAKKALGAVGGAAHAAEVAKNAGYKLPIQFRNNINIGD